MSPQKSNKTNKLIVYPHDALDKRVKEGLFIVLQLLSVSLFAAFVTYNKGDPGWSTSGDNAKIINAVGAIGAWLSDVMLYAFGYLAYLFPAMIMYSGFLVLANRNKKKNKGSWLIWLKVFGFLLAMFGGCGLAGTHFKPIAEFLPSFSGGILGIVLNDYFSHLLNALGTTLLFLSSFLVGITLATGLSWLSVADCTGILAVKSVKFVYFFFSSIVKVFSRLLLKIFARSSQYGKQNTLTEREFDKKLDLRLSRKDNSNTQNGDNLYIAKRRKTSDKRSELNSITNEILEHSDLPSIDLLDESHDKQEAMQWTEEELTNLSRSVETKLMDFGIVVKVEAVYPGPVITRFELQLAPGVKASKITALSKDLARSLSLVSVRVVEVIPGKSVVGLEIPNQYREIVRLRDLISSKLYQESNKPLTLALGKDIAGESVIVDLAKMPHLLIAGTTGAGKSVGVNAILLSMLYKSTPEQLRLILIDPKMLELSIYEGIPHLLTPVVTDMKDAANALKWCVAEMERRYQLMASVGIRNLVGYNKKITDAIKAGKPLVDPFWNKVEGEEPPLLQTLPNIVVIIDEFADMIMVVGKKVEELIARIAQKARAAGIHLILATQRPSVDVITGLIKANIPTRIAFQVSSKIDSRTILDQQGAEQLLGCGDMLYLAPGGGIPKRVHGAFVSDDEVHAVVKAIKASKKPAYIEDLNINSSNSLNNLDLFDEEEGEQDPLYEEAVYIVTKSRRASISNLQRRLKIGYNRAARLIEDMEEAGIVSAMQTNGSREVLMAEPMDD